VKTTNSLNSLVSLNVYHKCYKLSLIQNLAGLDVEYSLMKSYDILDVPRFTTDFECIIDVTFSFYNTTTDKNTGVTTTTVSALNFPNPYLSFDAANYKLTVNGNSQAIGLIGEHHIIMKGKLKYGLDSA
jgi:hypothetical protein